MMRPTLRGLLICLVLAASALAMASPNYIVNGEFSHGLTGWQSEGSVTAVAAGGAEIRGIGAARQRYNVPGLRIILFGGTLQLSSPNVQAVVRAQCFDRRGHPLMDLEQAVDPKKGAGPKGDGAWLYFKTQAHTDHLVISVENRTPHSTVVVHGVALNDDDRDRVTHAPECNLDEYMRPVWEGNTVSNETVLLLSERGGPAHGRLLFAPTKIDSVRDSTLRITYREGVDYRIEGREITALPGSLISTMRDTDFPTGDYPWLSVAGRHINVTYEHRDRWEGPTPLFAGGHLPRTLEKLRAHRPLTIVADGDSITLGINVSGFRGEPPYMPTWAELFARRVGEEFRSPVHMVNVALGGMTAQWGADNARDAVAALDPDLVLIAFGMNDFWSVEPADFRGQIVAIMDKLRAARPDTEFILISSIRFDPAYTKEAVYVGHMTDYAKELRGLVGNGVALLDMTEISEALYNAKKAKDLMADPMHPDDFLARWYAQGLVAMLTPPR